MIAMEGKKMAKKVLILGAGYAGVEVALTLAKKKRPKEEIDITIIDKNPYHTLLTELHEVAGNKVPEEAVAIPLREIFKYTPVNVIKDEIKSIDFSNSYVASENHRYEYDYLVIALGSEPNFYGIEGMDKYAYPLWSLKDAIRIREHIKECFIKASQEQDVEKRKKLLTFVVGGGGFTGVEMIGELSIWVKTLCEEYNISRDEVNLILVEALPVILCTLSESNRKKVMRYLARKNVNVITDSPVAKVAEDFIELRDGTKVDTYTLIWTAGIRAARLSQPIDIETGPSARIKVDKYTRTQYPNVYAVGDIAAFISGDEILPALVETAIQTGRNAAKNILADIRNEKKEELSPKLHGIMVSVGSYCAVSEVMGRKFPIFISIILKYMVNIHYLFRIGGFELVFRYIKNEFFYKRQSKSIVERHFTVLNPTFWLVPLRLFFSYSWLVEGIGKISGGWLTKPLLAGLPADTTTSASVTETGEVVFRIISEHTPAWYAWIAENIIIPNALFFQVLIVLAEVGLGLAFLSGTFTFIACLVSLGLNLNFILSTGLYDYNWWFIPAAIALMGKSGHAFGVDHYLIPYLMRQWRYFVRNKKIKLLLFK